MLIKQSTIWIIIADDFDGAASVYLCATYTSDGGTLLRSGCHGESVILSSATGSVRGRLITDPGSGSPCWIDAALCALR